MSFTSDQLISEGSNVPLHALNMSVRNKLGNFLDPEGFVTGDYSNDFQGLAEVIGFDFQDIKNFHRHRKPTQEVLYQWGTRPELSPTVDNLIRHLQTIGRADDVITECAHLISEDNKANEFIHIQYFLDDDMFCDIINTDDILVFRKGL